MENSNFNYRVTFTPNFLIPFTFKVETFALAQEYANVLADFDLGRVREQDVSTAQQRMLSCYKAYRRSHGINHPDLIHTSYCTIDKKDENNLWWVVSEDLEYEEEELYMEAFDNDIMSDYP